MSSENGRIVVTTRHDLFPVELRNGQLELIERGYGRLEREVAPALYVVRCEAGGPFQERLVKVEASQTRHVDFGEREIYMQPSPAPVPGTVARHEYYSDPADDLALIEKPHVSLGHGARLVLFAVSLDYASGTVPFAPPIHWHGVRLRRASGEVVLTIDEKTRVDEAPQFGRSAIVIDLDPGGYFLEWPARGEERRKVLQPLWLASPWITMLFAGAVGKDPLPQRETVSIHMRSPRPEGLGEQDWRQRLLDLRPEQSRVNGAAELALASLRTGRRQVGDDHLRLLLHRKFDNPMLGVLGAHLLLQEPEPDVWLFDEVLHNLGLLFGGETPDLIALEVLARQRFGGNRASTNSPPETLDFPPMIRRGLVSLEEAAWQGGAAPKLRTRARLASLRLLSEAPWTVFWHEPGEVPPMYASVVPDLDQPIRYESVASHQRRFIVAPGDVIASFRPGFFAVQDEFAVAETQAVAEAQIGLRKHLETLKSSKNSEINDKPLRAEQFKWTGLPPDETESLLGAVASPLSAGGSAGLHKEKLFSTPSVAFSGNPFKVKFDPDVLGKVNEAVRVMMERYDTELAMGFAEGRLSVDSYKEYIELLAHSLRETMSTPAGVRHLFEACGFNVPEQEINLAPEVRWKGLPPS